MRMLAGTRRLPGAIAAAAEVLAGCGAGTGSPAGGDADAASPGPTRTAAADATDATATAPDPDAADGREVDRISVDPEEVDLIPPTAVDAETLEALLAVVVPLGADEAALRAVDLDADLLVAFVVGECPTGDAALVLEGGEVRLEGRESDGVCEAIDEEVQLWAIPWAGLPDPVTVRGAEVRRPPGG